MSGVIGHQRGTLGFLKTETVSIIRSEHIKGSEEQYILGQNTTCEF